MEDITQVLSKLLTEEEEMPNDKDSENTDLPPLLTDSDITDDEDYTENFSYNQAVKILTPEEKEKVKGDIMENGHETKVSIANLSPEPTKSSMDLTSMTDTELVAFISDIDKPDTTDGQQAQGENQLKDKITIVDPALYICENCGRGICGCLIVPKANVDISKCKSPCQSKSNPMDITHPRGLTINDKTYLIYKID